MVLLSVLPAECARRSVAVRESLLHHTNPMEAGSRRRFSRGEHASAPSRARHEEMDLQFRALGSSVELGVVPGRSDAPGPPISCGCLCNHNCAPARGSV